MLSWHWWHFSRICVKHAYVKAAQKILNDFKVSLERFSSRNEGTYWERWETEPKTVALATNEALKDRKKYHLEKLPNRNIEVVTKS